ncbi:Surfactin synthase subunit 3 [Vibrio aerogenes CECT 7868]|uniref:Surfactin synthase subunit 3 n=1 Tax=Vibrio aerogenes CECT 7868 TaxID=1216006 RepID=A0A1M5ZP10_9VIBR|nr:non-ribosomal peptide synthetase [Vibrio aerogenes]SHI26017.1 Surfactin synthase subunit 3 [Vibrio aerogenes CECT 7868]
MMELSKNNIEDILPLTPLQAGMLYHDLLEKDSHHHVSYNQQVRFRLTGTLNVDAFRQAWQCLIDRHAALRVVFKHDKSAEPIQIVLKERDFVVHVMDLTALNEREKTQQLDSFIESDKRRSFVLERDIPMRVSLLKSGPEEYWFVWSFHHICLDGWCVASLQQELFTVYQQLIHHCPVDLPPAPSFSRYIKWYKSQESHQDFWRQYLSGYTTTTSPPLPTLHHDDQKRRKVSCHDESSHHEYDTEVRLIGQRQWLAFSELSIRTGATPSTLFQCLWGLFLAKVNETNDVVFGSVQSIRPLANSQFERLIGLCINTIPFRVRFSARDSLEEIAGKLQLEQLGCPEHATMSVSEIQAQCSQTGQLFDHFIAFENYPASDTQACGKEKLTEGLYADEFREYMPTSYPFHIAVLPTKRAVSSEVSVKSDVSVKPDSSVSQTLQILFKYVPRKVEKDNVRSLAYTFCRFIEDCLAAPDSPVADISLSGPSASGLSSAGRQVALTASCLTGFHQQYARDEHTALIEGNRHLTHQQLRQASLVLACQIKSRLSSNTETVALYDTAGTEMIVAIFACFHLGIPYVPMDPANPLAISGKVLKQANAGLIMTSRQQTDLLTMDSGIACLNVNLDQILSDASQAAETHALSCPAQAGADSIAYIIFTSGTTGEPKGVPVTHQSLINYVCWCRDRFQFSASDSSILLTSFNFDLGYTAIFGSLLSGGTLHIASETQRRDPQWVADYIRAHQVTFLKLTPSYLHMLLEVLGPQALNDSHLTRLIMGGEPLNYSDLSRLSQHNPALHLFNHYGPTENTIGCCANKMTPRDISGQYQNIGRPAHNTGACILNRDMNECPPYVEGELCLSGSQLMHSYLNPDHNHNRLTVFNNQTVYRTGDRAFRTLQGDIIFVGREQQSVKIDGYRVDLNAVQRVIQNYSAIKDCLVDSFRRDDDTIMIVALVIPADDSGICLHELRHWLGEQLPHYMHPSDFIEVSRFPMTTNGKLDRKTLLQFWTNRLNITSGTSYQAARTETETKLAGIWEKIFLKHPISTTTSFFELGGHSIKAIICISEIRKQFDITLPVTQIFTHPTIEALAAEIDRVLTLDDGESQDKPVLMTHTDQRILPLYDGNSVKTGNSAQTTDPLVYCLPAILGTSTVYKEIFEALKMPVQVFGFQCGGFVSEALPENLLQLADLAAESITQHYQTMASQSMVSQSITMTNQQPRIMLFGYSFGAILALEVAKRLEKNGHTITLLLLDSNLKQHTDTGQTLNEMRHIRYWDKIISLFEKHLNQAELRQIEAGVIRHQHILSRYLNQQKINHHLLHSEMICIESSENADQGYMHCFGRKTTGHCRVMSTSGDHYSMFQPPHFNGLLSNIRDAMTRLMHPGQSEPGQRRQMLSKVELS